MKVSRSVIHTYDLVYINSVGYVGNGCFSGPLFSEDAPWIVKAIAEGKIQFPLIATSPDESALLTFYPNSNDELSYRIGPDHVLVCDTATQEITVCLKADVYSYYNQVL